MTADCERCGGSGWFACGRLLAVQRERLPERERPAATCPKDGRFGNRVAARLAVYGSHDAPQRVQAAIRQGELCHVRLASTSIPHGRDGLEDTILLGGLGALEALRDAGFQLGAWTASGSRPPVL